MYNSQELYQFLSGEHDDWLFEHAQKICQKNHGDTVSLIALLEFSNFCQQNCHYCKQRKGNQKISRTRLSYEEILNYSLLAEKEGFSSILLQAGEDEAFSAERFADLIQEIRQQTKLSIGLSLGEQDPEVFKLWKRAGATSYLLRVETSNPLLYNLYHPERHHKSHWQSLRKLHELGFQTGSGTIVGLPSWNIDPLQILVDDLISLSRLQLHSLNVEPFRAEADTPLYAEQNVSEDIYQRYIALLRLCNPKSDITIGVNDRQKSFSLNRAGTSLLENITGRAAIQAYSQGSATIKEAGKQIKKL